MGICLQQYLLLKQGRIDYLAKPADAEDVEAALLAEPNSKAQPPENPMSADRVKWEHIQRVFELCNRNVSRNCKTFKNAQKNSSKNFIQKISLNSLKYFEKIL